MSGDITSNRIPILAVILGVIAWASMTSVAWAQETSTTRTTPAQTVGAYEISITAITLEPLVADVRFLVTVLDAETGGPVPDARVTVLSRNEARGLDGWALAVNTPQQPEVYRAEVHYDEAGVWQPRVEVAGDRGKVVVDAPSIPVTETNPSTAGGYAFLVTFAILIAGGGYVAWRIRRAQHYNRSSPEVA